MSASLDEFHFFRSQNQFKKANASCAIDASFRVENDPRPEIDHFVLVDLFLERKTALVEAVVHVLILEVTLSCLVAYGAINGVIDEQEFENPPPGFASMKNFLGSSENE